MAKYLNKYILTLLTFSFIMNSCHLVKPFLIKNKKKEERKEKRVEKKVERKEEKNKTIVDKTKQTTIDKGNPINGLKLSKEDTLFARELIKLRTNDYNTFSSKAKMHIEIGDQKQNFNANFRLQKNKIIWASISAYGIEVARAIITPDSVKAFERINKKGFLFGYHEIQKLINLEVEFTTLQNLIIGNAIGTDGEITDVQNLDNLNSVFIKGNDYINQITFNKTDSTIKQIQFQTMRTISSSSLLIAFSQYEKNEKYLLASKRDLNVHDVKGTAQLNMEIQKFEFDKPLEFPFSIPNNYTFVK